MADHRIETGPRKVTSFASKELLATLRSHYRTSMIDADGQAIVMGKEFAYLDWDAPHIFYVYRQTETGWVEIGQAETQDQAEAITKGDHGIPG